MNRNNKLEPEHAHTVKTGLKSTELKAAFELKARNSKANTIRNEKRERTYSERRERKRGRIVRSHSGAHKDG